MLILNKEVDKRFKNSTIKDFKFPLIPEKQGSMRLNEHRGGYVLPLIHHDLIKDKDRNEKFEKTMSQNISAHRLQTSSDKGLLNFTPNTG